VASKAGAIPHWNVVEVWQMLGEVAAKGYR
jgi:hypothetical protein